MGRNDAESTGNLKIGAGKTVGLRLTRQGKFGILKECAALPPAPWLFNRLITITVRWWDTQKRAQTRRW